MSKFVAMIAVIVVSGFLSGCSSDSWCPTRKGAFGQEYGFWAKSANECRAYQRQNG